MRKAGGGILVALTLLAAAPAAAQTAPRAAAPVVDETSSHATFALIVGVNTSVDPGIPTLRYADDDAARYVDLFRSLGARTYVLTRLDDDSRRLYPQIAAEALLPVHADLIRAATALKHDVELAKQRGIRTILYFVYAGHGNVRDGRGYISLEDARLDGPALDDGVIDAVGADQTHFIVDACDSYFLALGRGPGGERREAHGFANTGGLRVRDSVGLLLSTSSARQSHEWSGFQAGVFSHEVRSALYGAADADGDGQVSYREVSAFVDRANQAILNEQYRPKVYARSPKDTPVLLDLRARRRSRIDVDASHAGRYFLEDSRGVRIADFHSAEAQATYLLRPPHTGRLYLRRVRDDVEFVVPNGSEPVELALLEPSEARQAARGAANDIYESLFALPFGRATVNGFVFPTALPGPPPPHGAVPTWRVVTGAGLIAGAVAVGVVGGLTWKEAHDAASGAQSPGATGEQVAAANDRIRTQNLAAGIEVAGASAAALAGALLMLWPEGSSRAEIDVSTSALTLSFRGRF
jgi:hypothetical protein